MSPMEHIVGDMIMVYAVEYSLFYIIRNLCNLEMVEGFELKKLQREPPSNLCWKLLMNIYV